MKFSIIKITLSIFILCWLFVFSIASAQEKNTNQICLDILNEETTKIQGEKYSSLAPKMFNEFERSSYGLKSAQDFIFNLSFIKPVFEYRAVDFGDRFAFKMSDAFPYLKYVDLITKSGFKNNEEPYIHTYDIRFYYLEGENEPLYCRTRMIDIVKEGEKPETVTAAKIGASHLAEPIEKIIKINVNGKNFKVVHLNKPVSSLQNPDEIIQWRREVYVVPENINGKYDVYNLVDDFKKILEDYRIWEAQSKQILSDPEKHEVFYINGVEYKNGYNTVWGLRPSSVQGNMGAGEIYFIRYHILKSLLERNNSLVFDLMHIRPIRFTNAEERSTVLGNWTNFMNKNINIENIDMSLIEYFPAILNSHSWEKISEGEAEKNGEDVDKSPTVQRFKEIRNVKNSLSLDKEISDEFISAVKGEADIKENESSEKNIDSKKIAVISFGVLTTVLLISVIGLVVVNRRKNNT